MSTELETKLNEAVGELRSAAKSLEEKGAHVSELKEKINKTNSALDELERKNQELMSKAAAADKLADEIKSAEERIRELETKAAKFGTVAVDDRKLALASEIKSLRAFAEGKHSDIEKKYLRSDSNVDGGFLMMESNDSEIIKPVTEITPVRQWARVKRQSALKNNMVTRDSLVTGYWAGEGVTADASNSTYGKRQVMMHQNRFKTIATLEALMGGEWDLETELTGDFVESKAQLEGTAFISGNGVSKPHGMIARLISDSRLYASGSASALAWGTIVTMTGQLKTAYNPMFMMNRKTLAAMRILQAPDGSYAWQPGNMAAGVPSQVAGYGYVLCPDMDDIGSNTYPLAFADIRQCYTIVDAMESVLMRIQEEGGIRFILHSWTGGDVVRPEAGIVMKCATSV